MARLTMTFEPEQHDYLVNESKRKNISISSLVRNMIQSTIKDQNKKKTEITNLIYQIIQVQSEIKSLGDYQQYHNYCNDVVLKFLVQIYKNVFQVRDFIKYSTKVGLTYYQSKEIEEVYKDIEATQEKIVNYNIDQMLENQDDENLKK